MSEHLVASKLEDQALSQFDALVKKGEIYWEPTEEIKVEQYPFDHYFRISPITLSKPYNPHTQSRRPGFTDEDPDFTLCEIAPNHKLILNKYCWLRPQLILHTRDFQSQRDRLTQNDIEASWSVIHELGDRYVVVFNGGPDAGSSVAHKHLQLFPLPSWKTIAERIAEGSCSEDIIPFVYRQVNLAIGDSAEAVFNHYEMVCADLGILNDIPHSVLLTKSWLVIIPRVCASISGKIPDALMQGGANAIIGMQWLKRAEQLENWRTYGPMNVLREFCVSIDSEANSPTTGN